MNSNLQNARPSQPSAFSLELRIPPLPRYARSARAALDAFATYHHLAPADLESLTFALGEAIANAIEHAHTHNDIAVGFQIDEKAIVATVRDHGEGIGERATNSAFPPDTLETGRGFAIMKRCTDFFDVRSAPGEGTVVTLGRYRRTDR